ncbi:DNA mismatch repair protein MutT [Bacillus sp. FJAT-18017]|uniref:NUDIX hydrolase n=1 Tax=Bacillus sp. FJAT-18017 TaxID=1705566 RepID=UPI0006ADA1D3|nr:NUDIX domain-containing protein [Bacillus sp. FJAT-18017]ALC90629.1 DNA mismatch repair protein MutT [Bacillus sp. FJAT-18017]
MNHNGMVLVASVSIIRDNMVLMIKENKPSALNKWNFSSGRIEQGEDIIGAACREVKEETGYDVRLINSTGVYNFTSSTGHQIILFHFIGEIIGGKLCLAEEEIIDSRWIRLSETLHVNEGELRDPVVLQKIIDSIVNQQFYPIDLFKNS